MTADLRAALAARYPSAAISHEWLTVPGGSENVVVAMLDLLPHAELLATMFDPDGGLPPEIAERPKHLSFLDRIPGAHRHYPKLLPLMDLAFRRLDVSGYDLVLSSNHACAKNVRTHDAPGRHPVHVCYCHTPMRYAWEPSFLEGENLGRIGLAAFKAFRPRLLKTDLRGAAQVDVFVANSTIVAKRIREYYERDSTVVFPPVDVGRHLAAPRANPLGDDAPYLVFGRVVPYKNVDIAVQACERLGRPLVVAGAGRDLERVKALAGPHTTFAGRVGDTQLTQLLATSRALLFPGQEDFGIVPVEAQAAGLPVVGYGVSGLRDTVTDGVSGVLYDDPSVEGLCAAIERFEGLALAEADIRDRARAFGPERFVAELGDVLLHAGD